MKTDRKFFRISIPSHEVEAFRAACAGSDWTILDTGERVMTEEGPDGEAILLVEPNVRQAAKPAAALVH